jgi:hypothetical protein
VQEVETPLTDLVGEGQATGLSTELEPMEEITEMEAIQVATDHPESIPATGVSAAAAIPGTMAR